MSRKVSTWQKFEVRNVALETARLISRLSISLSLSLSLRPNRKKYVSRIHTTCVDEICLKSFISPLDFTVVTHIIHQQLITSYENVQGSQIIIIILSISAVYNNKEKFVKASEE